MTLIALEPDVEVNVGDSHQLEGDATRNLYVTQVRFDKAQEPAVKDTECLAVKVSRPGPSLTHRLSV